MATTYPNYPATTFEQAVELAIFSSNQLHNIINADSLSTVATEDGNIPSLRKALIDNLYFKTPAITWSAGTQVTVFNQLYTFSGSTTGTALWYAPTASANNIIVMGDSPEDDANWRLYGWDTYSKTEINSENGASYIGTSGGKTVQDALNQSVTMLGEYENGPLTLTSENQEIRYVGLKYYLADGVSLPYTTTGNTATTWATDGINFVAVGDVTLRQELISSTPLSQEMSLTTRSQFDAAYSGHSWGVAGISFGGSNNRATIIADDKGRIKVSSAYKGLQVSSGTMFPTVHNTGRIIKTTLGTYPQKIVRFPSDKYESDNTSPALGFSYSADGKPTLTLISPTQYAAGSTGFPDEGASTLNSISIPVALGTDIASQIEYNAIPQNSSQQYLMAAKWKVSSTPWNTELKMLTTSSNTTDNFVGTITVEANIQSSGTLFSTTSNLTQINLSKYFKVKFDGLRDRVPLNSATTATIPRYGCTSDGTYLYLWLVIPGGQSSVKNILIHQGTGNNVTYTPGADNLTTSAPSGLIYIPIMSVFNGENASAANDGAVIAADSHIRICGTSGTSSRVDITKDGFIWGGYGTYKSFRESCTITRSSTGVYVVTGPHQSYDWSIRQPVDTNGQQVAIAMVTSTASSGYSVTVSVYSIKYTYNSSTGAVTRGTGDLVDIPAGTWVDLKGSTTF